MQAPADLIIAAADAAELSEIGSWDGFKPATFAASEFPVDVVRFAGSASRPVVISRARRAETLKALPATLRERAQAAFERAARRPSFLSIAHGKRLDLAAGPLLMGVVNVTPDSFSDGGLYFDTERAAMRAVEMFEQGAALVDIGGESTRPATYGETSEISEREEIERVVPVTEAIRRQTDRPLSIDTRKAAVARAAIAAGVDIVNDVSALRHDPEMAPLLAETAAGAILMHMKGDDPRTMQRDVAYEHPLADIASGLAAAAGRALEAGVASDRIVLDPGLGFGKSPEGNLLLLKYLAAFRCLGFPVAVGASRKAFVRRFSGVGEDASREDRLPGSLACLAAAVRARAALVRVHDVLESARFVKMLLSIESAAAAESQPAGVGPR